MIKGEVVDIVKMGTEKYRVDLKDGRKLLSKSVVISVGQGMLRVPTPFSSILASSVRVHHSAKLSQEPYTGQRVLVIGGGSSAAQVSLLACSAGATQVVMCSRRPLVVRPFELESRWVHPRESGLKRFEFYTSHSPAKKLAFIRRERIASVTPFDMDKMQQFVKMGVMELKIANIDSVSEFEHFVRVGFKTNQGENVQEFDRIVLATGFELDVSRISIFQALLKRFHIAQTDGFPQLQQSLRWRADLDIFCVGAASALVEGPEAFNMLGARRAVSKVASSLLELPSVMTNGNTFGVLAKKKHK